MKAKRWEVFFHGGPLDGTSKVYDGAPDYLSGATIVQPVHHPDHGYLRYEYALTRRNWWSIDATLTGDPIEAAVKRKRTMLCFKTELASLLEKYGATIEPSGYETDGLTYTVTVDGTVVSEWVSSWE